MKKFLLTLLLPIVCLSQPMQWQPSGIPVQYNDYELPVPWTGGMTDSKPEFVDIDGDGDYDCFIGDNIGTIWYFENIGTEIDPEWEFVTDYYDSIKMEFWSQPVFCDIDNDNDYDLFAINGIQKWFFINIGTNTLPIFSFIADTLSEIIGSTIDFGDFNNDGDYDIISGSVWYYENTGNQFNFSYIITDTIITINYVKGRSICDLDNDNDWDIVVGEDGGNIWYLRNDGTPEQYNFTVVTENLVQDVGWDAAPTLVDIDGDEDLDLFVGTGLGGTMPFGNIWYFENVGTPEVYDFQYRTKNYFDIDTGIGSVPRLVDIDADGDLDLFVSSDNGKIAYWENTGDIDNPNFTFQSEYYQQLACGLAASIEFVDWDGDNDLDLMAGFELMIYGQIVYYENIGTADSAVFEWRTSNLLSEPTSIVCFPATCDIDNDNDYDLFVGKVDGAIRYYENTGNAQNLILTLVTENYEWINVGDAARPYFYDIDDDGDFDLFVGCASGEDSTGFYYFENIGTPYQADYAPGIYGWGQAYVRYTVSVPCFADIDNDTDGDLFIGTWNGGVAFYRNMLIDNSVNREPGTVIRSFTLQPCHPNPFNSSTAITFTINQSSEIKLAIYNQLGQEVETLDTGHWTLGKQAVVWDASRFSSGVYYISLESNQQKQTRKVILLK